jgi:hypothetical protein
MTGLDLLAALRRAVPGLPVAVITADAGPGPSANAARRQADAFLQKPVPAAQLVAVARALIGASRVSLNSWIHDCERRAFSDAPVSIFADDARRIAYRQSSGRYVRHHHAGRSHDGLFADRGTQNCRSGPDPGVITDADRFGTRPWHTIHDKFVQVAVENIGIPRHTDARFHIDVLKAGDNRIEIDDRLVADFQMRAFENQNPYPTGYRDAALAVHG